MHSQQISPQDQPSSGDEPAADPGNSEELKKIEDAIKAAKINLKNYRNTLNKLKGLKDPETKKRKHADLETLVQEVVQRDQIPMPSEEDLALFDGKITSSLDTVVAQEEESEVPSAEVIDIEIAGSGEELTGFPCCELVEKSETLRVDRNAEFTDMRGFHSTYHVSSKYQIKLITEKTNYRVETLEHIHSGKKWIADLSAIGPDRSKASWDAIAFLICMAIQTALPIDRLRKLFKAVNAFSGSSICRYLLKAADKLHPIYICLCEQFAKHVRIVGGDDSKTRVLGMEREAKAGFAFDRSEVHDIIKTIEKKLGRVFPRKDGKGLKSQLNVSHIHGLIDQQNRRSIIYLFRTHFGSVGDLLSKILEMKPHHAKRIIFQGDLSSTNFPNKSLIKRWIARFVGCAAHARRAFFRFRKDDDKLCDRMLELFAMVSAIETQIDSDGRTPRRILKYRQAMALPIWEQIIALAHSILQAEKLRRPKNKLHFLWPKGSKLYQACQYIVCNRQQLTAYIFDYRLCADNNRAERLLRGEKILLVSCKFRQSEIGRVTYDILRSLSMTAHAACGDPKAYFSWALKQQDKNIKAYPQLYTPLAFFQLNEAEIDQAQYHAWYMKQPKNEVKAKPHEYSPSAFRKIHDESAAKIQATGS